MQDLLFTVIYLVAFILPAYFANSTPVVLGGGLPLDLKAKLGDFKRLFGDGKTIRGFASGVLAGTLIGELEALALPATKYSLYSSPQIYILAGFLLGLGTMIGDLAGSFLKRRFGMKRGHPSFILDQLFFLAIALLFAYPFIPAIALEPQNLIFLFALTYVLHVASNYAANKVGLKKVPW